MDSSRPTVDHATYIRERLRTYSKGLMLALRAADTTKSGTLTVPQFQLVLRNFDIDEVPDRCVSTSLLVIFHMFEQSRILFKEEEEKDDIVIA